jgi:hypothetical protein
MKNEIRKRKGAYRTHAQLFFKNIIWSSQSAEIEIILARRQRHFDDGSEGRVILR